MVGTGGLLAPVMGAFLAVANGDARHVLVYRTVKMMGGSILPPSGGAPPRPRPAPATRGRRRRQGRRRRRGHGQRDGRHGAAAHVRRVLGGELARHARAAPHVPLRHHEGATRRAGRQQPAERRVQPARRVPRADDDGRLPQRAAGVRSVRVARLRRAHRRVDRGRRVVGRLRARLPEPTGPRGVDGRLARDRAWDQRPDYPKMASIDAAADLWSTTDLTPSDVDIAELYDGFTFLTLAWLEALGFCGTGESGPFVEGGTRIALDGDLPLNTYGGQLSAGRMHGYWVLHEACLQLRGEAGERQVEERRGGRGGRRRRPDRRLHTAHPLRRIQRGLGGPNVVDRLTAAAPHAGPRRADPVLLGRGRRATSCGSSGARPAGTTSTTRR